MKCNAPGVCALMAVVMTMGCRHAYDWRAEHVATMSGFKVPECALYEAGSGVVYVANIESDPDGYWADDGKGHISTLGKDLSVTARRWVDSKPAAVIHSPKGMCTLGGHLYFTDNTRLMRCALSGRDVAVLATGFERANDLGTDGKRIWLSDTVTGKVFAISPEGDTQEILAPPGINGITFFGEKLYGVSWTLHEVYELDPSGKNAPVAFGLAEHFENLDGIEVLNDGTFVVSDFVGNAVYAISSDRSSVTTLINISTPADIGLNRAEGLLYVPQFSKDTLSVYRMERSKR